MRDLRVRLSKSCCGSAFPMLYYPHKQHTVPAKNIRQKRKAPFQTDNLRLLGFSSCQGAQHYLVQPRPRGPSLLPSYISTSPWRETFLSLGLIQLTAESSAVFSENQFPASLVTLAGETSEAAFLRPTVLGHFSR